MLLKLVIKSKWKLALILDFISEKELIAGLYSLDFTYKALKPEKPDFSSMTQEFKSNCHRHFRSLKVLKLVTKNTLLSKMFHKRKIRA
jgi:hypothetical protein